MSMRVIKQPDPLSWSERYSPEVLRSIGEQVEALLGRHSNLELYKRSIEWQLGLMAAQMHEEDVLLHPRVVFLLVEMRGSGGLGAPLKQIASILGEVGYWKPPARVQNYRRQDVYYLGKSAQRLFDDYAVLDRRVKQLQSQLGRIREQQQMGPETTPRDVLVGLAMACMGANVQTAIDRVVGLLGQTGVHGWFSRWLMVRRGNKQI